LLISGWELVICALSGSKWSSPANCDYFELKK
jgi:hypothetical protein